MNVVLLVFSQFYHVKTGGFFSGENKEENAAFIIHPMRGGLGINVPSTTSGQVNPNHVSCARNKIIYKMYWSVLYLISRNKNKKSIENRVVVTY